MKKQVKAKTLVLAGLGAIGVVVAGFAASKRLKSPITSISWSSTEVGKLDIAWYDDEPNVMYKIYWSNRKGVRVKDPNTYINYVQVTTLSQLGDSMHHKATISMVEEWVYVVITKKGYISSEFEAKIKQHKEFNISNLNVEVLKKAMNVNDEMSIAVSVLEQVSHYKILLYAPNGKCDEYEYYVQGTKTVIMKFPKLFDSIVYIGCKIDDEWSIPEFLFLFSDV